MSSIKSFIKNTFIYGIAAVLPKAINVLLVGLHTKTLPNTAQFNVNTEFYVWAAYFNVLLTFGMETTFFKYYNSEKNKNKVLSTSFFSVAGVSILILGPLFVFAPKVASWLDFKEVVHYQTLIGILLFDTLTVIPFAYLRVSNKAFTYTLYRILNIGIYALLNVIFLVIIKHPKEHTLIAWYPTEALVGYIFLANLIASLVTFMMVIPLFKKFEFSFDKQLLLKMLRYGWPILVAGLAYVTNENLDKLILPRFLNPSIAGAYAGAYKLGVFMSLYIMAFKLGAEPFFFNVANNHNAKEKYALVLRWFTILGILIILAIVFYIDFFANLLLKNNAYLKTLAIVPIILIANLFLGIYNNLSVWYKITNQTRYGMYFSIIGGILTVIGLLILVPILGYMGAAWVTFIAYGIMMLISYYIGQQKYYVNYQFNHILFLLCLTTVLSFVSFYLFRKNHLINTLLFISVGLFIYWKEHPFIKATFIKRKP